MEMVLEMEMEIIEIEMAPDDDCGFAAVVGLVGL